RRCRAVSIDALAQRVRPQYCDAPVLAFDEALTLVNAKPLVQRLAGGPDDACQVSLTQAGRDSLAVLLRGELQDRACQTSRQIEDDFAAFGRAEGKFDLARFDDAQARAWVALDEDRLAARVAPRAEACPQIGQIGFG